MTQPIKLKDRSKKELTNLARKRGIAGWDEMSKDELLSALARQPRASASSRRIKSASANRPKNSSKLKLNGSPGRIKRKSIGPQAQRGVARNTNGTTSAEEQVERSKFDVGIPTKDPSAKVPKDLPTGYGKDRIVVMVRDPYWLHCYWELTRHAIQRAEAALGQEWHASKPILRLLDVTSHDTTSSAESPR